MVSPSMAWCPCIPLSEKDDWRAENQYLGVMGGTPKQKKVVRTAIKGQWAVGIHCGWLIDWPAEVEWGGG